VRTGRVKDEDETKSRSIRLIVVVVAVVVVGRPSLTRSCTAPSKRKTNRLIRFNFSVVFVMRRESFHARPTNFGNEFLGTHSTHRAGQVVYRKIGSLRSTHLTPNQFGAGKDKGAPGHPGRISTKRACRVTTLYRIRFGSQNPTKTDDIGLCHVFFSPLTFFKSYRALCVDRSTIKAVPKGLIKSNLQLRNNFFTTFKQQTHSSWAVRTIIR